jgi:hypothetical protein
LRDREPGDAIPSPRFRGVDRTQILELYGTGFPLARE